MIPTTGVGEKLTPFDFKPLGFDVILNPFLPEGSIIIRSNTQTAFLCDGKITVWNNRDLNFSKFMDQEIVFPAPQSANNAQEKEEKSE